MKKSKAVPATFVATVAALSLAGCSSGRRDCVDSLGRNIPDIECRTPTGTYTYPHWVYRGGSSGFSSWGRTWSRSSSTGGGSSTSVGGVSRGGFGSSSSGSSSFGG